MLKKNRLLFLTAIFFCSSAFAENFNRIGYLSVNASKDYQIFINDSLLNQGSFSKLALKPGDYDLSALNPNNLSWLNRGFIQNIEIIHGETTTVFIPVSEYITIRSKPFGSEIYNENRLIGTTPLVLSSEKYNGKNFILKKAGFEDKSFVILKNNKNYSFDLVQKDNDKNFPNPVLNANLEKNNFNWLKEGLVVTSLLSSWASFYFKREADKNYDKYLHSADPQMMQYYFNRTGDFDKYSEIAIGVSVVALGTYIYILISD